MIPVASPLLGLPELLNVQTCIENGWLTAGRFLTEFEHDWATYCGRKYGIAVSNGTVALQLAVAAAVPAGSEIIMPAFTIISCALAAVHAHVQPVFVDVDPETWCLDTTQVEAAITSRTKAIMPVHMYGHPADMAELSRIATAYNLLIIEDAAQAHGAEYIYQGQWVKAGYAGHLSCFSFYSNKIVTTGEGGMVLVDDPQLAGHLQSLRNLCFGRGTERFLHTGLGYNARMTVFQAAIGVAQIQRITAVLTVKRQLAATYRELLNHPAIQHPVERSWAKNVYWMYGIVLDRPAKPLIAKLQECGIETRPFFYGLHQQPGLSLAGTFPVTEHLATYGLYLPSGTTLTATEQQLVATSLKGLL